MRIFFTFFVIAITQYSYSQPYPIGSTTITFNDPARGGRAIPCEIYYPAITAGNGQTVAEGVFPILSFGHGFVMGVGAYANLWQAFVPQGYIMVLPTTEGGFSPSHGNFGLDLAFVIGAMQARGADPDSPFFGKVASTAAIMGHSMGGGASFLGASSPLVTAVLNYAPAETDPSAIAAAANVDKPVLIFAGSQDCVTPAASNQTPMYYAVPPLCKAFITITGGGHCNFANSNFNCEFGQFTCGGGGSLGRPGQQAITQNYTLLWLNRYLKDDLQAGETIEQLSGSDPGIATLSELNNCPPPLVRVDLTMLLDGPYVADTDLMRDALRSNGLVPIAEPHTVLGMVNEAPGQQLDPTLLETTGPTAVTDWVLVELRTTTSPGSVTARANGLVLRNGTVISPSGGPLVFDAPSGNYHVVVLHRNHLGAMTANALPLTREPTLLDMSAPGTPTFGQQAQRVRNGKTLLWAGNTNLDAQLKYTGANNDRDLILSRIGGIIPTATVQGYYLEDADLDGQVRYTGAGNDKDLILVGIGGSLPTVTREAQIP